jgi:recombinational DNA repair protein (RecF pathway)
MSYHVYTTEGIILKRTPFGEANILLHIFTKDLGLIIASARSARLSVSKLRTALQEGSFVIISCVKGKGGGEALTARRFA